MGTGPIPAKFPCISLRFIAPKVLHRTKWSGRLVMAGLVLAIESSGTAVRSEMLASILIICFSLVMVVYWFRYCCALVLRNSQEQLDALPAISDSRFDVAGVIERLQTEEKLASLHQALDRDYQVFTYLVQHAA